MLIHTIFFFFFLTLVVMWYVIKKNKKKPAFTVITYNMHGHHVSSTYLSNRQIIVIHWILKYTYYNLIVTWNEFNTYVSSKQVAESRLVLTTDQNTSKPNALVAIYKRY